MDENMARLTAEYVRLGRQIWEHREAMVKLLRRANNMFKHDEELRRTELKKVQRAFYKGILSDILRDEPSFKNAATVSLVSAAEEILDKKGYMAGRSARREGRRTYREHQHYGTLRVRWLELTKAAGIPAIDSRGG